MTVPGETGCEEVCRGTGDFRLPWDEEGMEGEVACNLFSLDSGLPGDVEPSE